MYLNPFFGPELTPQGSGTLVNRHRAGESTHYLDLFAVRRWRESSLVHQRPINNDCRHYYQPICTRLQEGREVGGWGDRGEERRGEGEVVEDT